MPATTLIFLYDQQVEKGRREELHGGGYAMSKTSALGTSTRIDSHAGNAQADQAGGIGHPSYRCLATAVVGPLTHDLYEMRT